MFKPFVCFCDCQYLFWLISLSGLMKINSVGNKKSACGLNVLPYKTLKFVLSE